MVVTKVERGSVAENLLQFGDIITSISDKEIESKKEFEKLLAKLSQSDYSVCLSISFSNMNVNSYDNYDWQRWANFKMITHN